MSRVRIAQSCDLLSPEQLGTGVLGQCQLHSCPLSWGRESCFCCWAEQHGRAGARPRPQGCLHSRQEGATVLVPAHPVPAALGAGPLAASSSPGDGGCSHQPCRGAADGGEWQQRSGRVWASSCISLSGGLGLRQHTQLCGAGPGPISQPGGGEQAEVAPGEAALDCSLHSGQGCRGRPRPVADDATWLLRSHSPAGSDANAAGTLKPHWPDAQPSLYPTQGHECCAVEASPGQWWWQWRQPDLPAAHPRCPCCVELSLHRAAGWWQGQQPESGLPPLDLLRPSPHLVRVGGVPWPGPRQAPSGLPGTETARAAEAQPG